MIVVGLVGRIAAGKSTVARLLAARGARVIDADAIAHAVLDEPDVRRAVVARFGDGILAADGRISRPLLGGIVFGADPAAAAALADLEAIVHPRVRARMEAELAALRRAEAAGGESLVVVLDVPLLVQAGWVDACDRIVVVECDEAVRRARLAARGMDALQVERRDRAWERGGDPTAAAPHKTCRVDASRQDTYTSDEVGRMWADLRH